MGILDFLKKNVQSVDELEPEIEREEQSTSVEEKNSSNEESVPVYTEDMLNEVMEELKRNTEKTVIRIKPEVQKPELMDSKFGGIPYLPHEAEAPEDIFGNQMRLLAQIRLDSLPENDLYDRQGMLQFWALDDDLTGLDLDNLTSGKGSRVFYYKELQEDVTEEEVLEKYNPYCEAEGYFPIQDTFSLTFTAEKERISTSDFRFEEKFVPCWNEKFPENKVTSFFDLPEDLTTDIYNDIDGFGHKLGGYPAFTQEDPRDLSNRYGSHQTLLLQIDSIGSGEKEIMWGDSGICSFFITEEALKQHDFEDVLYTWDCY